MTATMKKPRTKGSGSSISIPFGELESAAKIAAHPINGRSRSAVLHNLCIGAGKVTGANDDYRVDVNLPAASFEPTLLRKERLMAIINNSKRMLGGDEAVFRIEGDCCTLKIGHGEWRLPTEDASLYPSAACDGLDALVSMPAEAFSRAMRAVIYAIDKESSRYALGGVLVECVDDKVHFVATDGRRISVAECVREGAQDDFVTNPTGTEKRAPIIPKEPLAQLMARCSGCSDAVTLLCGNGKFVGQIGDVVVTTSTIDGRFPNWRDLFDDVNNLGSPSVIDRESLWQATRCAAVVATEDSRGVMFQFGGDTLTLTAKASSAGQSRVECPVQNAGCAATVKIDPVFVTQFLASFSSKDDDPTVRVYVQGEGEKTLFCVDESYKSIIMPMAKDA